ncbi:hypothetical protein EV421DRAFT_1989368 [Armillaria borealis]|uniref:Uncharacterized protein n=1 Tax=Armillaria borealis TaxID=47425 RepID=A0AA39MH65_9AGAR|nr:hypothetical protein EV421DRAFT_1989368 [Armillaria borealis]
MAIKRPYFKHKKVVVEVPRISNTKRKSNPMSEDDIKKIVIEEGNKPLPQAEARKWAKAHCPLQACKASGRCSKSDDELFERVVKRVPSLERSVFDEIQLSRSIPSFSDSNSALTASTSSAQERPPNNLKSGAISFKRWTPPTNAASEAVSEAARSYQNPYAGYLSSFEIQMQALKRQLDDQVKENGVLKVKLEVIGSTEASLKGKISDSNQQLEKAKADAEAIIQNLRGVLESKEADHKAADTRTREATVFLREGTEKALRAELRASKEQNEIIRKELEDARQRLTKKDGEQERLQNEVHALREEIDNRNLSPMNDYKLRYKEKAQQLKSERIASQQRDMAEYFSIIAYRGHLEDAMEPYKPRSEPAMRIATAVKGHLEALDVMAERRLGDKRSRSFSEIMGMLGGGCVLKEEEDEDDSNLEEVEDEFDDDESVEHALSNPSKRPRLGYQGTLA